MDIKELFLTVEAIANEKNISKDDVFASLEEALAVATKRRKNIDAVVKIDKQTQEFKTFRQWLVVEDGVTIIDEDTDFNKELHIYKKDAGGLNIGDFLSKQIETEVFSRIAAQIVKQVIIQKVREAEKTVIVDNYLDKIGDVVFVTVKRVDRANVYVDMGGVDGIITKNNLIPNESVRKNDRLKACIKEVKSTSRGAQIFLSRVVFDIMIKLFEMEVPEISDGAIEIMSGARDPGIRSKLAVKAKDRRIDPIGSCIGMGGTRVKAVSNELNGERIEIILWDKDPGQFVINAIAPATVSYIVVDENTKTMDIVVEEDQLALAIGRGGQNVKLASRLTNWKLNVISVSEAEENKVIETKKINDKLAEQLKVDSKVAGVLIEKGFSNVEDVVEANIDTLAKIKEFDANMVGEIKERAEDAQLLQAIGESISNETLMNIKGVDKLLAQALIAADITTVNDLADLSTYELLEIKDIGSNNASAVIITAREQAGIID